MSECENCCSTAEYSLQENEDYAVYCKGCLIDTLEMWEEQNKKLISPNDVDFKVTRILLAEEDILPENEVENIYKHYGLLIKKLEEENQ